MGNYCLVISTQIKLKVRFIVIHQPQLFHVVTFTHFIIQNGDTALMQASFEGYHGVVELLLGAGANPDVQNKVSTGRDSSVYSNLSDG